MLLSVILSTFNQPRLLELSLLGYSIQNHREFELLVADDGSAPETAALLRQMSGVLPFELRHVWHEHRGFRKTTILNRAVRESRGDYLIFSDGDCVPRADFIATHTRLAARGRFLSGGRLKLSREVSRRLTPSDVLQGRATDPGHLLRRGASRTFRTWRLGAGPRLSLALDRWTPTRATWNGHNASCWREDAVAINGFDQRMGYGGEDREFGERLIHAGLRGRQIRHRAVCVHLWHERSYIDPVRVTANRRIRREVARSRSPVTRYGLNPI